MKVTIYFAGTFIDGYRGGGGNIEAYLNGELAGWIGWGGKLKLKDVPEGENTIEFTKKSSKRKIRFTASQNVKIWIREEFNNIFQLLMKGEDIKILENVVIKEGRGEEEITEGPPLDGKPEEEEKKKAEEKPKESLWETLKKINDDL